MRCRRSGRLFLWQLIKFSGFCFAVSLLLQILSAISRGKMTIKQEGVPVTDYYYEDNAESTSGVSFALILTYQRCGSSFMGELFDENPDAFYLYEPMDALYVSMFGSKEGYNVPTDITTYWNGTLRDFSQVEIDTQVEFLQNLFTCQMDKIPVEFFAHKFWFLFAPTYLSSHGKYRKCCYGAGKLLRKCQSEMTPGTCPNLLGENWKQSLYCHNELQVQTSVDADIRSYKHCLRDLRTKMTPCIKMLQEICLNSSIRAIKTVRTPMVVAAKVMRKLRDLKIVHLVRDPRGVTISRRKHGSFHGRASRGDIVKEAEYYCRDVARDLDHIKDLPQKLQKRIHQTVYDAFTQQPIEETLNIYDFINKKLPNITQEYLESKIANSSSISDYWQEQLTYKQAKDVVNVCQEFFKNIKYYWR